MNREHVARAFATVGVDAPYQMGWTRFGSDGYRDLQNRLRPRHPLPRLEAAPEGSPATWVDHGGHGFRVRRGNLSWAG